MCYKEARDDSLCVESDAADDEGSESEERFSDDDAVEEQESRLSVAQKPTASPRMFNGALQPEESDGSGNESNTEAGANIPSASGEYPLPAAPGARGREKPQEAVVLTCVCCHKTDGNKRRWWCTVKITAASGDVRYENSGNLCFRCGFVAESRCTHDEDVMGIVRRVTGTQVSEKDFRVEFFLDVERLDAESGEIVLSAGAEGSDLMWDSTCGYSVYAKALIIPLADWDLFHKDICSAEQAGIASSAQRDCRGTALHGVVVNKHDPVPLELKKKAFTIKVSHTHQAVLQQCVMPSKEMLNLQHSKNLMWRLAQLRMKDEATIDNPNLTAIPTYDELKASMEQVAASRGVNDQQILNRVAAGEAHAPVREVVSSSRFDLIASPSSTQILQTPQTRTRHARLRGPPPILSATNASSVQAASSLGRSKSGPRPKFPSGSVAPVAAGKASSKGPAPKSGVIHPPKQPSVSGHKGRPVGSIPKIPLFTCDPVSGAVVDMNFTGIFLGRLPTAVAKPAMERYNKLRSVDPVAAGDAKNLADLCHSSAGLNQKCCLEKPWADLIESWNTIAENPKASTVLSCLPPDNMVSLAKRMVKEHQTAGQWKEGAICTTLARRHRTSCERRFGLYFEVPNPRFADIWAEMEVWKDGEDGKEKCEAMVLDAVVDCMIGGQFYLAVAAYDDSRTSRLVVLAAAASHLDAEVQVAGEEIPQQISISYKTLKGFAWMVQDEPEQFHGYYIEDAQFVVPGLMENSKKKKGVVLGLAVQDVKPGPGLHRWLQQKCWKTRLDLIVRTQGCSDDERSGTA